MTPASPGFSGYVDVGALELYCERHGDGHPLVLLHGAFGTIESCFAGLLPALARHFEVIAVELQGHGRTRDIARPEHAVQMFRLLGGAGRAQLALLPGTSHEGILDRVEWLIAMITAFLLPPPPPRSLPGIPAVTTVPGVTDGSCPRTPGNHRDVASSRSYAGHLHIVPARFGPACGQDHCQTRAALLRGTPCTSHPAPSLQQQPSPRELVGLRFLQGAALISGHQGHAVGRYPGSPSAVGWGSGKSLGSR